jgi:hypothetical protein
MFHCEYCSKIFATNKILRHHQMHVKYCLKIQEEIQQALAKALDEAKKKEEAEEVILKEKTKELTCQFCSKEFKTKYLLSNHQTHTKYCLKLQESQNSKEIISSLVTCKFCSKNFSDKNFARHDAICKKKNKFLTDEIMKMKKDLEIARMNTEKDQEIARMKTEKDLEIARMKVYFL